MGDLIARVTNTKKVVFAPGKGEVDVPKWIGADFRAIREKYRMRQYDMGAALKTTEDNVSLVERAAHAVASLSMRVRLMNWLAINPEPVALMEMEQTIVMLDQIVGYFQRHRCTTPECRKWYWSTNRQRTHCGACRPYESKSD